MPIHSFRPPAGRLVEIEVASEALTDNLLGDPTCRRVAVYLPEGYDASDQAYPVFVDLVGFTGSGFSHLGFKAFQETVPQRLDRLVSEGRMGPVIAVFPDCFTSLGGNQYVNSLAMGRWADFLVLEMLPCIEEAFRARPGRENRAVFGKSSGGYGAIVHGLRHAEHWGAVACHSGDMAFDLIYRPELPRALNLLAKHDGIAGFLAHLEGAAKISGDEFHVLMTLAMAASYDPDPDAPKGIRLPVDPHTCALDEAAWARWLAHDPVVLVEDPACQENLCQLAGLYIDCGSKDQYNLVYGARQLVARLDALGISHHYEEFDDNHSGIDYRMDHSLPWLYQAIAG
jgi:enterochelin esterase-like enzyme